MVDSPSIFSAGGRFLTSWPTDGGTRYSCDSAHVCDADSSAAPPFGVHGDPDHVPSACRREWCDLPFAPRIRFDCAILAQV